ncbi:MAG: cytochrome d ubiquinol oxidase subunit II [Desulfovibrio sp.]|jgi:cytochrome d ubiquinol oxidase subunit II|nr:cytochrome d ubiquinol oxidase subunit II [Desulfovibrio sp.]
MSELLSYDCLKTLWFLIWGLLWAIYFILDGFDLGMGTLLPFLAGTEDERRVIYNAAGPFWDGNEVWLITAGGVTFAAFPLAYAVMFSALYAPLLILLFALIFRAVSFEFRNKIDNPQWRFLWDCFQFLGNAVPALLLGVAFANLFQGIPINEQGVYMGNLFSLLNIYGLLGGVLFVAMFSLHGAIWLGIRAEGSMHAKGLAAAKGLWPVLTALAVAFLMASAYYTPLYANYAYTPALSVIPVLAVVSLVLVRFMLAGNMLKAAFFCSAGFILFATFFGVMGMFPAIIPSNITPGASITLAKAASSPLTLSIMLAVSLVCVPVVILYQSWVYSVFSYKITKKDLDSEHSY